MLNLADALLSLPRWLKVLLILLGAALLGGGVYLLTRDLNAALLSLGVLVVAVAVPLGVYFAVLRVRNRNRGSDFERKLKGELGRKFFEGLEQFKESGRDLYSVPWYVLVGEPGAGKTQAIKHANILPAGFNDPRKGEGGTVNMDWWFARGAVLLDTAGRLMFEAGPEWREFLRLLKRTRGACPINGMILAIPASSLLGDSADKIGDTAGKIAQQFDAVQRELGVRFPVYAVITKSDLIPGFREFFHGVDDPAATNQILGWSNPAGLDEPFRPELVEQHLDQVRSRLKRRRHTLLLEPKIVEERSANRLDQVDALYTFPDSLARIGSRLRLYLETIFMPSEWSMKPLFVRGIYFTTSMTEGAVLDTDLAEAFGLSPDAVKSEMAVFRRDRSLFLKDVFLEKVFPEKGLVTGAKNISSHVRKRKMAIAGGSLAASLLILGAAIFGYFNLEKATGDHFKFWTATAPPAQLSLFKPDGSLDADAAARHRQNFELAKRGIDPPPIFRPYDFLFRVQLPDKSKAAHTRMFEQNMLRPIINGSAKKLSEDKGDWPEEKRESLRNLVRLVGFVEGGTPPAKVEPQQLASYLVPQTSESSPLYHNTFDGDGGIDAYTKAFYGAGNNWPQQAYASPKPGTPLPASQDLDRYVRKSIENYGEFQKRKIVDRYKQLDVAVQQLQAHADVEADVLAALRAEATKVKDQKAYDAYRAKWTEELKRVTESRNQLMVALKPLSADLAQTDLQGVHKQLQRDYTAAAEATNGLLPDTGLTKEPDPGKPTLAASLYRTIRQQSVVLKEACDAPEKRLKAVRLAELQSEHLGPPHGGMTASADGSGSLAPPWRFHMRVDALEQVVRMLALADESDAKGDFRQAAPLVQSANVVIEKNKPGSMDINASSGGADKVAAALCSEAAAIARENLLCMVFSRMLDSAGETREAIRRDTAAEAPLLSEAPLTRVGAAEIAEGRNEFNPAFLKAWGSGWAELDKQWKQATQTGVLEQERLQKLLAAGGKELDDHVAKYANYWQGAVTSALRPAPTINGMKDWATFQLATATTDGGTISDQLAKVCKDAAAALRVAEEVSPAMEAECKQAILLYEKSASAAENDGARYEAMFKGWRALGRTSVDARTKILKMDADSFVKLFETEQAANGNLLAAYWFDYGYGALELLKREADSVRSALTQQIAARLRFPVVRSAGDTRPPLKMDEMRELHRLLGQLSPAESPAEGDRQPLDKVQADALKILRNGKAPNPGEQALVKKATAVIEALLPADKADEALKCKISLIGSDTPSFKSVRVARGRFVSDTFRLAEALGFEKDENALKRRTIEVPCPSDAPVAIELLKAYKEERKADQPADVSINLGGPGWSLVQALFDPQFRASPRDKERKSWRLFVPAKPNDPTPVEIWVDFENPLPPLEEWPSVKATVPAPRAVPAARPAAARPVPARPAPARPAPAGTRAPQPAR